MATIQHLVGTNKIKDEWQKINANFDALNAENNGWRIYNDVTELGLTPGSETMEAIVAAMANRSMLIFSKTTGNASPAYPMNTGLLIVTKHSNPRTVLEFYSRSSGRPVKWVGYYDANQSPNFTGWSQDALEYETGTWTPALQGGSSGPSNNTYASRFGSYVRIGNIVHVWCKVELSAKDTNMAGPLFLTGLPFVTAAGDYSATIGWAWYINLGTGTYLTARFDAGNTRVTFWKNGSSMGPSALSVSEIRDNTQIAVSGVYRIA
jgi:hypothetical protein